MCGYAKPLLEKEKTPDEIATVWVPCLQEVPPLINTHNHRGGKHNHCACTLNQLVYPYEHYRQTSTVHVYKHDYIHNLSSHQSKNCTLPQAPCFSSVPCWILKNNFQSPMFIRFSLHNTNKNCVGTYNHCVDYLTSKHYWKTNVRAMFIRGSPSTTQTTTVWIHTTTV